MHKLLHSVLSVTDQHKSQVEPKRYTLIKLVDFPDFLEWYNNLDVAPFLKVIEKQVAFYAEHRIDMFKDGISVPGLTMKFLFSCIHDNIYRFEFLFNEKD